MFKLINNFLKKKDKKSITDIELNKNYCNIILNSGSFGKIVKFDRFVINNYGKIIHFKIKNVVIKCIDIEEDSRIKYIKKNKYLYAIFNNHGLGEALCSIIISKLFTSGISPHFVLCFGTSLCDNTQEIYYEKLNICNINYVDNVSFLNHIIISIFHSLYTVQYNFRFIHSDLHIKNVFLHKCDTNKKYFKNKKLNDIKYFAYKYYDKIKKKDLLLYTHFHGVLIKIGDFGLSALKYDKLIIFNKLFGYIKLNPIKNLLFSGKTRFIPEYFHIIRELIFRFGGSSKILLYLLQNAPGVSNIFYHNFYLYENIDKMWNTDDILSLKIFDKFRIKPKDSNEKNTLIIKYKIPS